MLIKEELEGNIPGSNTLAYFIKVPAMKRINKENKSVVHVFMFMFEVIKVVKMMNIENNSITDEYSEFETKN